MLKRQSSANGVVYYVSPLLQAAGVPHAFSTRVGGISPPPFDSLNLGNPGGCQFQDDDDRIAENYRRLQDAAGCDACKPCRVYQVHGSDVVRVRRGGEFDPSTQADALVTDDPSCVLSVRVADCVPILIASRHGDRVAAIHAGWRGAIAGVVPAALRELAGQTPPGEFVAAIGPCIGYEAFEVGPEVLNEFVRVFGPDAPCKPVPHGKGRVDLRQAVRRQLIGAGIPAAAIDVSDRCTCQDREEFYSHRRDNGVTGRMAAVIQARQA
jgi:hypothetical protein